VAAHTRYRARDAMIVMEGDFTDRPEHIPELVKRFEGGADVVVTERTMGKTDPVPARRLRRLAPWILRPFVRLDGIADLTSTYRLMRISAVRDLLRERGDERLVSATAGRRTPSCSSRSRRTRAGSRACPSSRATRSGRAASRVRALATRSRSRGSAGTAGSAVARDHRRDPTAAGRGASAGPGARVARRRADTRGLRAARARRRGGDRRREAPHAPAPRAAASIATPPPSAATPSPSAATRQPHRPPDLARE
jgi:hypothetical protein